jgi:hypothetical protein
MLFKSNDVFLPLSVVLEHTKQNKNNALQITAVAY